MKQIPLQTKLEEKKQTLHLLAPRVLALLFFYHWELARRELFDVISHEKAATSPESLLQAGLLQLFY